MIPTFDLSLLPPSGISLKLAGSAIESPRALSGITGAIDFSAGGFWMLKLKRIQMLADPEQHRAWLELDGLLTGGVAKVYVATPNDVVVPGVAARSRGNVERIRNSDGSSFDDGGQHAASKCIGEFAASASVGSATVQIRVLTGQSLRGGAMFGVWHPTMGWRMHRIVSVDSTVGDVATVWVRPPLRAQVGQGQMVDFYRPRCLMRLQAGQSLGWEPDAKWESTPDVTFVEAMEGI